MHNSQAFPIKRALISVSDKTGLLVFAKALNELGIEILSTGGTYKQLVENNILIKCKKLG